jgi:hypothetical protein
MVLKFLGIGKKSEFVLEAPPADSQPAAKAKPAAEPAHTEAVAAPAVENNGKAPAPAKEAVKAAVKTSGKTLKEANAEKKAKAEKKAAEKKVTPDKKAATPDKVEVKAAPAAPAPAPKAEPAKPNFATTMQLNSTPRRRPGPSLDMFKDMAKQVGPRK